MRKVCKILPVESHPLVLIYNIYTIIKYIYTIKLLYSTNSRMYPDYFMYHRVTT